MDILSRVQVGSLATQVVSGNQEMYRVKVYDIGYEIYCLLKFAGLNLKKNCPNSKATETCARPVGGGGIVEY